MCSSDLAFTPVTGSGGTAPLTYGLRNAGNSADATLPSGMVFNTSTGAVSGTATATLSATTFTVRVTDANGATATATFSLTVNAAPAATQAVASSTKTTNLAYSAFTPVTGSAGTAPLAYALRNAGNTAAATLPAGMTFNTSTGEVSGTATATLSVTTFTVQVTDANGATATNTFALTVEQPSLHIVTSAAGAASRIAFTAQPQVEILDALGARITSGTLASATVTLSVSSGGTTYVSGAAATTTAALASGVTTFSGAGIGGTIGTYTLTYSATNTTSATQSVSLSAGAVAKTHVVGPPTLVESATSEPITISTRDADDNAKAVASNTSLTLASSFVTGSSGSRKFSTGASMSDSVTAVTVLSGNDTVSVYYSNTATSGTFTISATAAGITSSYATSATPAGSATSMLAAQVTSSKFRCQGTGSTNASATSTLVTSCAGVASGDILLAAVDVGANVTVTAPAGWVSVNSVSDGNTLAVFYKYATASDNASSTYTFSWSGNKKYASSLMVYTNGANASPIDVSATASGSGTSAAAPAVTTATKNTTLVYIAAWDKGASGMTISNFTAPTDLVKEVYTGGNNSAQTIFMADMDRVAAGLTGARSVTVSGLSNVAWRAVTLAIKPQS